MEISMMKGPSRARSAGVAVWLVVVGFIVGFIVTSDDPRDRSADDWIYLAIVSVVIAVVWWLLVVRPAATPEGNTPAKVGLIAGIVAVLSIVIFWTGLPLLLGGAAFVLGLEGRERAKRGAGRAGVAQASTILGAILAVGWFGAMLAALISEI